MAFDYDYTDASSVVQRVVNEAERQRVRMRGLAAESQRRGRVAQVLNKVPVASKGTASGTFSSSADFHILQH